MGRSEALWVEGAELREDQGSPVELQSLELELELELESILLF